MKIGIVTGKRGGFDAMLPLMLRLEASSDHSLVVYVVDQHTMGTFGGTAEYVENRLPDTEIIRIHAAEGDDFFTRSLNCARVLSALPVGLVDYLVVYGDRGESLAAAQCALIYGVPIIHLEAGERTGTIDDQTRWAISSLADICFAPSSKAFQRLVDRGHTRCILSGDLHLDAYADMASLEEVYSFLGHDGGDLAISLFHPDPDDPDGRNQDQAIRSLLKLEYNVVAIYPCSDPGHQVLIDNLLSWDGDIDVFPNIPGPIFRTMLQQATLMVGNSSAGLKEAPFVETYAIDIGSRQVGREREYSTYHSNNGDICDLIEDITENAILPSRLKYPYGMGDATDIVFRWINDQ